MKQPPAIQMADLYSQYLHIKPAVDSAIQSVIDSTLFIKGGKVSDFESSLSKYLDAHVISCGNGTDALQLAFMALELQPGDEVITTPFTFVATAEVLALLGLKPLFCDTKPGTFTIDVSQIQALIGPRTKAILPVHLFGQHADMEEIMTIARTNKLYVVEDAAQSLGAEYRFSDGTQAPSGTMGEIGCTSFFPSKNLGAFGDGGALYTRNTLLAERIRSIANHGMKVRYHYDRIGINSRLDSLQAAVLDVKLPHLPGYIASRQAAADWYDQHLSNIDGLKIPERNPNSTHTFHQYTLLTPLRDALMQHLKVMGIPSMIYYPKPLHMQEAYRYLGYSEGDFPNAEIQAQQVLSLPMHTELSEEQLSYITDSIQKFFGR